MLIPRSESPDFKIFISPSKLSSCIEYISSQAPALFSIAALNSSHLSVQFESMAFAAVRSVLLNSVEIMLSFCAAVIPSMPLCKSLNISLRPRILPWASYTSTPKLCSALDASPVGLCRLKIILRRWVPPSAPLRPLSARIPSAVLSSVVPPARPLAVPPTVSMASPNCETLVFALLAVCANWSAKVFKFASVVSIPRALILSVTMSLARARSIAPAPASLRTVGSAVAASSALYPARAK